MLCYSLLKEKRWERTPNYMEPTCASAWAFTLWGDPTVKLPRAQPPENALPHVRHQIQGNTLILSIPDRAYDKVVTEKYQSELWPNGRLAGLLTSVPNEEERRLVPFVFAEVPLPQAPAGKTPLLRSKIPASHWVFCWDARRNCGYLIVEPRAKDEKELRFQVHWDE